MEPAINRPKTARGRVFNLIKILVSVTFLALLLSRVNAGQALQLLADMDAGPFLVAVSLYVTGELVRSYRWGVLVWSLGIQVRWRRLAALYFVGSFYNLVLPTGFGGDAVKVLELSRDAKASSAISSVVVERFSGLFVLFLLASLALAGSYQLVTAGVRWMILVMTLLSLVAVALLVQRTWIERWGRTLHLDRLFGRFRILRDLYQSLNLYSRRALAHATGAALLFNLMQILANVLLARAVGIRLPVSYFFLFIPIVAFSTTVPSLGGLGVREGAYVFLFSQVGVEHDRALALALARDLTLLAVGFIGVVIYVVQNALESRRR